MPARLRIYFRRALLVICSIGVSIVVAELVLRYFSAGYLDHPTSGHPILHHVQPADFEFTSFDIEDEFGGHLVIYNENGLRVPKHGYVYDDSLRDVIFLGDSYVEASEVSYDDSFVGLFAEEFPDFNARNFGVSSYSPLISYLQLKLLKDSIDPVLIVHLIFENDLEDDQRYYDRAEWQDGQITAVPGKSPSTIHLLLRESYVARLINRARWTVDALARNAMNGQDNTVSYYLQDPDLGQVTTDYVVKTAELARDWGSRYLVMCVPSKIKFNKLQEHKDVCAKIKAFARDSNIEYVDLDEYFSANLNGRKPFFDWNIHFNRTGHRLTYRALVDYLKERPIDSQ